MLLPEGYSASILSGRNQEHGLLSIQKDLRRNAAQPETLEIAPSLRRQHDHITMFLSTDPHDLPGCLASGHLCLHGESCPFAELQGFVLKVPPPALNFRSMCCPDL